MDDPLSQEENKTYEEFKSKVTDQPFYGSDAEAYSDDDGAYDDGDGDYDNELRDDFSLSDTGAAQEYVENVDSDDDDACEPVDDE